MSTRNIACVDVPSICLAKQCFSTAHSTSKPTQDPSLQSLSPPCPSSLFSQIQNLRPFKGSKNQCLLLLLVTFVDSNAGTLSFPRGLSLQPGMCMHWRGHGLFLPSLPSPASRLPRQPRGFRLGAGGGEGFPTNFRPRPPRLRSAECALPRLEQAGSEGSGPCRFQALLTRTRGSSMLGVLRCRVESCPPSFSSPTASPRGHSHLPVPLLSLLSDFPPLAFASFAISAKSDVKVLLTATVQFLVICWWWGFCFDCILKTAYLTWHFSPFSERSVTIHPSHDCSFYSFKSCTLNCPQASKSCFPINFYLLFWGTFFCCLFEHAMTPFDFFHQPGEKG